MFKFAAPVAGLFVFLIALFTMPPVWAQTANTLPVFPDVEVPATLLAIPFIGDLVAKVVHWLPVVFQIVGAFSMIAAMTANQTDDKIVDYILKCINFLGFNFGTAKNDPNVGVTRTAGGQ